MVAASAERRGQASVELVAAIPALVLVTLLVAQLALAGYALWSAGVAARAGARAAYVGGRRRARPPWPRCRRRSATTPRCTPGTASPSGSGRRRWSPGCRASR